MPDQNRLLEYHSVMGGLNMCKAKCPQCGFEFEAQKPPTVSNLRWTQEEETALLRLYQTERKTIPQIAEELNRTQDAVRNHLFKLRGTGRKPDTVTVAVTMTAEEYSRMQGAAERESNAKHRATVAESQANRIAGAAAMLVSLIRTAGAPQTDIEKATQSVEAEIRHMAMRQKTFI
jgi:predicted transcriptional regulator